MNFEFATAGRIVFGQGSAEEAMKACTAYGKKALLVRGCNAERHAKLIQSLRAVMDTVEEFEVEGEPGAEMIHQGLEAALQSEAELVVALGGGSVIDTAKAIAALANEENWMECLEVVGSGRPILSQGLPCVALPTTAGTGSEVTKNAVITIEDAGIKVSLRHTNLLPAVAVIDPKLSAGMPPALTAATGMDALTQLLEAFTSGEANVMTDSLCREGLLRVGRSLRKSFRNGKDMQAREDMTLAALFSGLALANAKLGAVHGVAGPLGGMINAAHGSICAALVAPITRANLKAMQHRDPQNPAFEKYKEAAVLLGGENYDALKLPGWLEALSKELRISSLAWLGLEATRVKPLVQTAMRSSSMKGNPIELTQAELVEAVEQSR